MRPNVAAGVDVDAVADRSPAAVAVHVMRGSRNRGTSDMVRWVCGNRLG